MSARPRVAVSRSPNIPLAVLETYLGRLRDQGVEPVDYVVEPGRSLRGCAGLLITGGRDVDPALYGETPHPETEEPMPERDAFELALLREALTHDLPVLAICRGHQLLNVCCGGSLLQHIESGAHTSRNDAARSSASHPVRLVPGSRVQAALGLESLTVNSRHHQAVTPDRLAPGLEATGLTPDGLVEAVESPSHRWVVGVQWHPERRDLEIDGFDGLSARLFAAFASQLSIETAAGK